MNNIDHHIKQFCWNTLPLDTNNSPKHSCRASAPPHGSITHRWQRPLPQDNAPCSIAAPTGLRKLTKISRCQPGQLGVQIQSMIYWTCQNKSMKAALWNRLGSDPCGYRHRTSGLAGTRALGADPLSPGGCIVGPTQRKRVPLKKSTILCVYFM